MSANWLNNIFAPPDSSSSSSHSPAVDWATPPRTPSPSKTPYNHNLLPDFLRDAVEPSYAPFNPSVRVALLLDATTPAFPPTAVDQGSRGGRTAALALRQALTALVRKREKSRFLAAGGNDASFRPPEVHVLVKVFLNADSVAGEGKVEEGRMFAKGLSTTSLAVSAVDVGREHGAAEEAIRGHLPFLLPSVDFLLLNSSPTSSGSGLAADLLRVDPTALAEKILLVKTGAELSDRIAELELEEVTVEGCFGGRVTPDPPQPSVSPFPSATLPSFTLPHAQSFAAQSASRPVQPSPLVRQAPIGSPATTLPQPQQPQQFDSLPRAPVSYVMPPPVPTPARTVVDEDLAALFRQQSIASPEPAAAVPSVPVVITPVQPIAVEASLAASPAPAPLSPISAPHSPAVSVASTVAAATTYSSTASAATSSPSATRPSASTTTTSSAATPSSSSAATFTDARFRPLLSLLQTYLHSGQPSPRRADVGQKLKNSHPKLYTSWGVYVREAEKRGLVELGRGDGVGNERISLKGRGGEGGGGGGGEVKREERREEKRVIASLPIRSSTSRAAPPGAIPLGRTTSTTTAPPPAPTPPPSPPHPFPDPRPLLSLLLTLLHPPLTTPPTPPRARPLRSQICDLLRRSNLSRGPGARFFDAAAKAEGREGLREYLERVEKGGWVRTGREEGKGVGTEWVKLGVEEGRAREVVEGRKKGSEGEMKKGQQGRMEVNAAEEDEEESDESEEDDSEDDDDGWERYEESPEPAWETSKAPSAPKKRPPPQRFLPLILAIRTVLSTGPYPTPHWTTVGAELNARVRRGEDEKLPYGGGEGMKGYIKEAEREGWVRTGKVEGKENCWWVKAAPGVLALLPVSSDHSPSPSSSSTDPSAIPTRFHPLLLAIRSQDHSSPHWTNIGALLNRVRPRVYEEGGFKAYVREAEREGVIRTGDVEGKENCWWMRLTPKAEHYALPASARLNTSSPTTSSSTPSYSKSRLPPVPSSIPPLFLPLLHAILSIPYPRAFLSQVGVELNRTRGDKRPYGEGREVESFREYLERAAEAGVVKRGKGEKEGGDWVVVRPELDLPPELEVLRHSSSHRSSSPEKPRRTDTASSLGSSAFPALGSAPTARTTTTPATTSTVARSVLPSDETLKRWHSLSELHPFAPLILSIDYLSYLSSSSSSISSGVSVPAIRQLLTLLELETGGYEGGEGVAVFEQAGVYVPEIGEGGGGVEEERERAMWRYLKRGEEEGVVRIGGAAGAAGGGGEDVTVKLRAEWRGWEESMLG